MKNTAKISKIIQIESRKIACHHVANDAFIFDCEIKKQYDYNLIAQNITGLVLKYSYPIVLKDEDNNFNFISGWSWIAEKIKKSNKITVIQIQEKLNSNEINEIAWSYVLGKQLLSWPHTNCLAHFENLMASLPKRLLNSQLKILNKKSNIFAIMEITGLTRAVVRKQIENARL